MQDSNDANPSENRSSEGLQKSMDGSTEQAQKNSRHLGSVEGEKDKKETEDGSGQASNPSSGWLGWFSKSGETEKARNAGEEHARSKEPVSGASIVPAQQPVPTDTRPPDEVVVNMAKKSAAAETFTPQKRSWLQMWGSAPASEGEGDERKDPVVTPTAANEGNPATPATEEDSSKPQTSSNETAAPSVRPAETAKSSGWAFWSRDKSKETSAVSQGDEQVGELAISDTPSQNRPKRASISIADSKDMPNAAKAENQDRPESSTARSETTVETPRPDPKPNSQSTPSQIAATAKTKSTDLGASKELQKALPNLILPSFRDTFLPEESLSLLQQIQRLFSPAKVPESNHVHVVRDPPRLKRALAIGVHGYFPAPLIRTMLGQPTGTSIKFANMAAKAIRNWVEDHGQSCRVETVALEGEGRIAERVDVLWKLLLNWIDDIRKADFIMIACHSQGVPVAMMLVAKLISFGCVTTARIGVCAMAGVNLGPFPDYKSRWISGSAGELFDFSDPNSKVSQDYLAALEEALKFGVRVTLVGAIDDQLVSLEVWKMDMNLNSH